MYPGGVRTLVVSDIHSNVVALEAVLADASERGGFQRVLCLGDIVGYGPEPMACLERLWALGAVSILGNHDAGAVGRIGLGEFKPVAAQACRWSGEQLTPRARAYLEGLPLTVAEPPFTLVHGTPRDPIWEYLTTYAQAETAWAALAHDQGPGEGSATSAREPASGTPRVGAGHALPVVLVGHSHLPFVCRQGQGLERTAVDGQRVTVGQGSLVVNPGSVGQPRDGDPRAAYAVYDDEAAEMELRRVAYDIGATQRRMAELGLPQPLITRLSSGR